MVDIYCTAASLLELRWQGPFQDVVAQPGFEHHRRATRSHAMQLERVPANIHHTSWFRKLAGVPIIPNGLIASSHESEREPRNADRPAPHRYL